MRSSTGKVALPSRRLPQKIVLLWLGLSLIFAASCGNPEKQKAKHYQKGLILERRSRYTEAVVEFQEALKIDPQMAKAHYELGNCYAKLQYHDRAITAFDAARTLDSGLNLNSLVQIASIYSATGQPSLAEKTCHQALEVDPNSIDSLALLGKLNQEAGRTEAALSWFEKALAIEQDHVESRMALAEIAMREGRHDAVEEHLSRAIEAAPDNVEAKLALAKLYRVTDRTEHAIAALGEITEAHPNYPRARALLAEAYLSENRLDEARTEAEAFLDSAPTNTQAHFLMGAVSLKQKDFTTAVTHLTKAAGSPQSSAQTHHLLGLALAATHNPAQAIAAFRKALSMEPDNTACRLGLAQVFLMEGHFENAQREISHVLSLEPENEQAQQLLARAKAIEQTFDQLDSFFVSEGILDETAGKLKAGLRALGAGDLRTVKALSEELLVDVPGSPIPYNLLGLVFLRQNDLEQALVYFRKALDADSEFAASYINMANIYKAIGSHEQAAQCYRRALELSPKDRMLRGKFVKALVEMKRYSEAEVFLQEQIRQHPEQLEHRFALASLLVSTNRYPDARKELNEILGLEPDHAEAALLLADTLAKQGDFVAAAARFETLSESHLQSSHLRAKLALCRLALGMSEKARNVLATSSEEKTPLLELARALTAQKERRYDEAEQMFEGLLTNSPQETAFALMLANIRTARDDADAARALAQNQRFSEAFRKSYLGWLLSDSLSADDLRELNLGLALAHAGWRLAGITRIEGSMQEAEPNAALFELIGGLWEEEGQTDEAIKSYEAAIKADSSYWPAHYRLGVHSLRAGDTDSAERHLLAALEHQPDSLVILLSLAGTCQTAGKDAEAIRIYRKIHERSPELASATNNLAWLLSKNPETLPQALEYAQAAVTSQPLKAEVQDTLGWILFQQGNHDEAKQRLDTAALLNSLNPSIRYHRGMVYLKLGDKPRALENFRAADSSPHPFPEKHLNQQMLRELT